MLSLDELLEGKDLYHTKFPEGWEFVWRLLTQKEYRIFSALRSSGILAEEYLYYEIFERVYVGDAALINQTMPLGVPISIGRLCMYLSGDCISETLPEELALLRSEYLSDEIHEIMKRVILSAFPVYKPEELDELNRLELLRKFVLAEAMMQYKLGDNYVPLSFETKPQQRTPPPPAIDFAAENEAIKNNIHPWDMVDMIEDNHEAAASRKISTGAARKLDALHNKSR